MGFNCGIIGLPNVGKSTIFNALTAAGAQAANYPFCTIEPNTGVVAVPDRRLDELTRIAGSAKIIPTAIEFVDIAGLVKGASKGEGLGNQFLGHIRAVDALVHVVRCFDDDNVTHVEGSISPRRDVEVIETELLLADLESAERRLDRLRKTAKGGDKLAQEQLVLLERCHAALSEGVQVRNIPGFDREMQELGFLTGKPVVFVGNVDEANVALDVSEPQKGHLGELIEVARERNSEVVVISGVVESEISQLPLEERAPFLESLGLEFSGLDRLALKGYKLLKLITFFTVGPKEAHAWTCHESSTAVDAAGVIHTDFAKGFIRAEVISYNDYVTCGGESGARDKGLLRIEGKSYVMHDGDIVHFRFNV
jgi:GTP-binding protein YchF